MDSHPPLFLIMTIKVIPLGHLNFDWDAYLSIAKQALDRNITKTLDANSMPVKSAQGFLVSLAELKEPDQNPNAVMNNPGNLLSHMFYNFMVISDRQTPCELLEITPLDVHRVDCRNDLALCIVSGNLTQWRTAIINGCSDSVTYNLRKLLDECLTAFEKIGLKKLWSQYTKTPMSDGTIKLIGKK